MVIGILGVVGSISGVIGGIINGMWAYIVAYAIGIIISGLIIFADRTERQWGYLPYLVLNVRLYRFSIHSQNHSKLTTVFSEDNPQKYRG